MAFSPIVVPSFGGGLHLSDDPVNIRPDEWSWCDGWLARRGCAETGWSYSAVSAQFLSGSQSVLGLLPHPFNPKTAVIIVWLDPTTTPANQPKLATMTSTGVRADITWDGVGSVAIARPGAIAQMTYINGFLVFSVGAANLQQNLIQWNGFTTTFATIQAIISGEFITGFAAHAIVAGTQFTVAGVHTLQWCAANDQTTWAPAISNDADFVVLDDSLSPVTALLPLTNNTCGAFTRTGVHVLSPTGGIPAFTRQYIDGFGCQDISTSNVVNGGYLAGNHTQAGVTPYGVIYRSADDFRLYPNLTGLGKGMIDYYRKPELNQNTVQAQQMSGFHWHRHRRLIVIPIVRTSLQTPEFLLYDPETGAWSRKKADGTYNTIVTRHAVADDSANDVTFPAVSRHWFVDGFGATFREVDVPTAGAFVDTKDFGFGNPFQRAYWNRIKLDWEPLSNATTDAIQILAYPRDDLSPAILGSAGLEMDLTAQFVALGTVTAAGTSELPINLHGKYCRFRFKQSSGSVRVRGFTIYAEPAGDR